MLSRSSLRRWNRHVPRCLARSVYRQGDDRFATFALFLYGRDDGKWTFMSLDVRVELIPLADLIEPHRDIRWAEGASHPAPSRQASTRSSLHSLCGVVVFQETPISPASGWFDRVCFR
jgi:hypothetical protein